MGSDLPHIEKRRSILLTGLDLPRLSGIEIGPLDSPIVRKSDGKILYVDHATTDDLREKYAKYSEVGLNNIVSTDIVWGDISLSDILGEQSIDYAIASHVGEHIPDLITWLLEIQTVLRPEGQLRIVLPDKRVSFDYLREETRVVDLLDAYVNRARRPQTRQLLDCALYVVKNMDSMRAYAGNLPPSEITLAHTCESALAIARDALQNAKYVDVHCWVFTPRSFAKVMQTLVEYSLVKLCCAEFFDSEYGSFEFYVFLQPCNDKAKAMASWQRMYEKAALDIPGSAAEAARSRATCGSMTPAQLTAELNNARSQLKSLVEERELILNSTIWRATSPLRHVGRALPASVRRWLRRIV